MRKLVKNYNYNTAPAILVPSIGHTSKIPVSGSRISTNTKGISNARDLLARDIKELRRVYPEIPNEQLRKLIEMNKQLYPEMRKAGKICK